MNGISTIGGDLQCGGECTYLDSSVCLATLRPRVDVDTAGFTPALLRVADAIGYELGNMILLAFVLFKYHGHAGELLSLPIKCYCWSGALQEHPCTHKYTSVSVISRPIETCSTG